jgi:hypothetical protein
MPFHTLIFAEMTVSATVESNHQTLLDTCRISSVTLGRLGLRPGSPAP